MRGTHPSTDQPRTPHSEYYCLTGAPNLCSAAPHLRSYSKVYFLYINIYTYIIYTYIIYYTPYIFICIERDEGYTIGGVCFWGLFFLQWLGISRASDFPVPWGCRFGC